MSREIEIDGMKALNEKLAQFSGKELDIVMKNTLRKGAAPLRRQAKSNLAKATFGGKPINSMYGQVHYSYYHLPAGIKVTKPKNETIKVHILGNPILKWLNSGTEERYDEHHKDAARGRIIPDRPFFDDAIDQTENGVYDVMTENMMKQIDKIWNS